MLLALYTDSDNKVTSRTFQADEGQARDVSCCKVQVCEHSKEVALGKQTWEQS